MSGLAFSKSVKKDYRLSFAAGGSLYVIESKIFINIFLIQVIGQKYSMKLQIIMFFNLIQT